jgi:hypothetical protein
MLSKRERAAQRESKRARKHPEDISAIIMPHQGIPPKLSVVIRKALQIMPVMFFKRTPSSCNGTGHILGMLQRVLTCCARSALLSMTLCKGL